MGVTTDYNNAWPQNQTVVQTQNQTAGGFNMPSFGAAMVPLVQPFIQPAINYAANAMAPAVTQATSYLTQGAQTAYGALQNYWANSGTPTPSAVLPAPPGAGAQSSILTALRTPRETGQIASSGYASPGTANAFSPGYLYESTWPNFRWLDAAQQQAATQAIDQLDASWIVSLPPPKISAFWFQNWMGPDGRPLNPQAGNVFLNNVLQAHQNIAKAYGDQEWANRLAERRQQIDHLRSFGPQVAAIRAGFDLYRDPIKDDYVRRAMWDVFAPRLPGTYDVQGPDLSDITPRTLRHAANTLQYEGDIAQAYQRLGDQQIIDANRPYGTFCPDQGVIAWKNFEDFAWLAPSGTFQPGTAFNFWNYRTWGANRQGHMDYGKNLANMPSDVKAHYANGQLIFWEPTRYSFDGKTWFPRTVDERIGGVTNPFLEAARIHLMDKFIAQQKNFYRGTNGIYSNCNAEDIKRLTKIPQ